MKWKFCVPLLLLQLVIHSCTAQGNNATNCTGDNTEDDSEFLPFDDMIIVIAFAVILVLCIIITALVTFIVMCVCIRRKYKRSFIAYDSNAQSFSSKPSYQPVDVGQPGGKSDVGLHPNPAYAVGDKMNMDNNPAYKTCN